MVEDEVVDALVNAVTSDYERLSHRYYTLKASWLGLEKLEHWDRNAPLPGDEDRAIPWDEARTRVLAGKARVYPRATFIASARSPAVSSMRRGSMRGCAPARRAAPSRIRRCRPRIPISC